jgi:hypothetical protein
MENRIWRKTVRIAVLGIRHPGAKGGGPVLGGAE